MSTRSNSLLKLFIPAGGATPAPPIGPALGQKGIKAMEFCRQFNEASKDYLPGIPLRTRVYCKADRTFTFEVGPPTTIWLLKKAANIEKASSEKRVASLDCRYAYEIALVKSKDPSFLHLPLQFVYRSVLATARTCGINVFVPSN
jgi:large subunit ribosomal protein L11